MTQSLPLRLALLVVLLFSIHDVVGTCVEAEQSSAFCDGLWNGSFNDGGYLYANALAENDIEARLLALDRMSLYAAVYAASFTGGSCAVEPCEGNGPCYNEECAEAEVEGDASPACLAAVQKFSCRIWGGSPSPIIQSVVDDPEPCTNVAPPTREDCLRVFNACGPRTGETYEVEKLCFSFLSESFDSSTQSYPRLEGDYKVTTSCASMSTSFSSTYSAHSFEDIVVMVQATTTELSSTSTTPTSGEVIDPVLAFVVVWRSSQLRFYTGELECRAVVTDASLHAISMSCHSSGGDVCVLNLKSQLEGPGNLTDQMIRYTVIFAMVCTVFVLTLTTWYYLFRFYPEPPKPVNVEFDDNIVETIERQELEASRALKRDIRAVTEQKKMEKIHKARAAASSSGDGDDDDVSTELSRSSASSSDD